MTHTDHSENDDRLKTGVPNLDAILSGGIPRNSLIVFGGPPGAGKTILSQQIGFHVASSECQVIFFQTLSEPTPKTLAHAKKFKFFDQKKIGRSVHFIDLGDLSTAKGLTKANDLIMANIRRIKPALVVIDSFRAFEDLSQSREELRKFSYQVAINLMAWECTCLLLGEFGHKDIDDKPLFSVIDGIFMLTQREEFGEQQRFMQVTKMRSTDHSRDEHSLSISNEGIQIYAPKLTIRRNPKADTQKKISDRCVTGVQALDSLIKEGVPRGTSLLISGAAGTGKTILCLEFIYRGAKDFNEKSIIFLFEETQERLCAVGIRMGWDLDSEIKRGMLKVISIPQSEILIEKHLKMMHDEIKSFGAKRVAIDSTSVFLHKIDCAQIAREKIYQLSTIVQSAHAVGFFVTDVPFGSKRISRFGVEETIVDGIILLTASETNSVRLRSLEVYKMRNTSHSNQKHLITIDDDGLVLKKKEKARS